MNRPPSPGWLIAHSAAATIAGIAMFLPPFTWNNAVCLALCVWNIGYIRKDYRKIKSCLTSN